MTNQKANRYSNRNLLTKEQIEAQIYSSPELSKLYEELGRKNDPISRKNGKEMLIDFCTGKCEMPLTYDSCFKFIFNPETHPKRLSSFLSELIGKPIKVKRVLPNESSQLIVDGAYVVMDIVVELEDGTLANVEIQRISYDFCAERGACYSSDLVLRQYSSVREKYGAKSAYDNLKQVYNIVLLEKSDANFHKYPNDYIHFSEQTFNTGLSLNLLQKYIFIPLDIFKENVYTINNKLEAWIHFIASDSPEIILELIDKYPEFLEIYQEIDLFRRNIEEVLHMFSQELIELDKNAVQYMYEKMQQQLQQQLEEKTAESKKALKALVEKDVTIEKRDKLTRLLLDAKRYDDLKRSLEDKNFQKKLFEEFHL